MTVIRHWIAYDTTRPKAAHIVVRDAAEAAALRVLTVEGPFVHEDNLTGAVSAERERLIARIRELADSREWPNDARADGARWVADVLAIGSDD